MPVKPLSPEGLALPAGGKSKPMPVIVEVDPGCVIPEVFVTVKVKVFVWELNSQTTVAVENWPESTPVTVMVSARAVTLAVAITTSAAIEKINLPNRDIEKILLVVPEKDTTLKQGCTKSCRKTQESQGKATLTCSVWTGIIQACH